MCDRQTFESMFLHDGIRLSNLIWDRVTDKSSQAKKPVTLLRLTLMSKMSNLQILQFGPRASSYASFINLPVTNVISPA